MQLKIETLTLNDSALQLAEGSIVPRAQQVCDDVVRLWKEEPDTEDLKIAELHQRVLLRHPEWQISHHTLQQILTRHNLYATDEAELETYSALIEFPGVSAATQTLGLPKSVELLETQDGKGRGIFATRNIRQGELILGESAPLATIPPMEKLSLIHTGKVCSLCGNSLGHSDHFVMMNGLDCNGCNAVWCGRNCKKRDIAHAPLKHVKGKGQFTDVSGWSKFEKCCMENVFVAAYSVGIIYATGIASKKDEDHVMRNFNLLAQISQRSRTQASDSTNVGGTFDASSGADATEDPEPMWKQAYAYFKEAFPKSEEVDFETFLTYVGKFNINQLSGQIYPLYSFINHDCEPNVRYEIDDKLRLKVFARKPIKKGNELLTTYVNPLHGVKLRRRELRVNWGFLCRCDRCTKELKKRTMKEESIRLAIPPQTNGSSTRRKSSMRNARPDLKELLKNGQEFDLEIPEKIGISQRRRTSVRFDNNVTVAVEE